MNLTAPRTHELSTGDLVEFCSSVMPDPSALQRTMINEAAFGLSRVLPFLKALHQDESRVLEVGAGSLILSTYIACRGFDVTALEPMFDEFGFFGDLSRLMRDVAQREGAPLTLVRKSVDDFDVENAFDLTFSINALEHMPDPLGALDVMHRAVRPGGSLLIHCPNYDVPFDSHFGIVLLGSGKRLNEFVYRRIVEARRGIWDGLSFIRLSRVRRHCAARRYDVSFDARMLRDAVLRLGNDAIFAARMPAFLRGIHRVLAHPRVAAVLTWVPVRWQTPMEFVVRKTPIGSSR